MTGCRLQSRSGAFCSRPLARKYPWSSMKGQRGCRGLRGGMSDFFVRLAISLGNGWFCECLMIHANPKVRCWSERLWRFFLLMFSAKRRTYEVTLSALVQVLNRLKSINDVGGYESLSVRWISAVGCVGGWLGQSDDGLNKKSGPLIHRESVVKSHDL